MPMSVWNQGVTRLVAAGLSVGVAFGIAEATVRIVKPQPTGPVEVSYHPQLLWIPPPNQRGRNQVPGVCDWTFRHNSLGLRADREYAFQKTADLRILVLGDSMAYGQGVSNHETFAAQLEQRLNRPTLSVEIINAGKRRSGTDYALRFFELIGHRLQPDLTILCFFKNDFGDNARGELYDVRDGAIVGPRVFDQSYVRKKMFFSRIPLYNWLISWSHAANLIKRTIFYFLLDYPPRQLMAAPHQAGEIPWVVRDAVVPQPLDEKEIQVTELYLTELSRRVRHAQSDLMVLYAPREDDVIRQRQGKPPSAEEEALTRIQAEHDQLVISLTAILAGSPFETADLYIQGDRHWTVLGNRLVAEAMHREIAWRMSPRRTE